MAMETMHFVIRKAEMKEAPLIAEANIKMALETEGKKLDPPIALAGVKSLLKDSHKGFYLVASPRPQPERIAGQLLVTFEWSDWRDMNFWWIQSVYVDPEFRGQRVFGQLYCHLQDMARFRRDVAGLRLYVEKHNDQAKAVYEKLGMSPTVYDMYEVEF